MSNKFKSGLVFGFAMTLFFLSRTAIAWIAGEDLSTNDILKSFFASLLAGLVSGFLFGWLSNKFVAGGIITKSSKFEYHKNETIILQTPANHFVGVDAVIGNLFLTDKRLIFKSHNLNNQNHEWITDLADISHVETFKTLGLFNSGLKMVTNKKVVGKFVVHKQKQWIQSIAQIKTVQRYWKH